MSAGRVVVYGVGAIGAQVAVGLGAAGHDVLAVEPWEAHAEAIRRRGLTVRDPDRGERTRRLPVIRPGEPGDPVPDSPVDVLFLCVKSYDTVRAMRTALRRFGPPAVVVCLQNGMNEEAIAPLLSDETDVLGGVILVSAVLAGPGRVEVERSVSRATDPSLPGVVVGHWRRGDPPGDEGRPERSAATGDPARRRRSSPVDPASVSRVAALLESVWPAATTDDLSRARWSKLATNCMLNAVSGLAGRSSAETLAAPDSRRLMIGIGAEVVEVAAAAGHPLEAVMGCSARELRDGAAGRSGAADRKLAERASGVSRGAVPSLLQDLRHGRPTEIDFLNGHVVHTGQELGIATPLDRAVVRLMHRIEAGRLAPGRAALAVAGRALPSGNQEPGVRIPCPTFP